MHTVETVLETTRSEAAAVFFNALYQEMLPAFSKADES